jgi:proline iminopeptidase
MQQLVDDVEAFVKGVGLINYSLFGHSFGGMVALTYATTPRPGLLRLILSDTSASSAYVGRFQDSLKRIMSNEQFQTYERIQSDTSITLDEQLRRSLRVVYPYYWYNPPKPYYLDLDIGAMNLNAKASSEIWNADLGTYDIRKKRPDIRVPTLVLYGRYDIVFSHEDAKEIADGVADGRLVVLERSGHYPFFEENHLFTEWVRTFMQYYT